MLRHGETLFRDPNDAGTEGRRKKEEGLRATVTKVTTGTTGIRVDYNDYYLHPNAELAMVRQPIRRASFRFSQCFSSSAPKVRVCARSSGPLCGPTCGGYGTVTRYYLDGDCFSTPPKPFDTIVEAQYPKYSVIMGEAVSRVGRSRDQQSDRQIDRSASIAIIVDWYI